MSTEPKFPPFPPWAEPAVTGLAEITDEPIDFTPVLSFTRVRPRAQDHEHCELSQGKGVTRVNRVTSVLSASPQAVRLSLSLRAASRLLRRTLACALQLKYVPLLFSMNK